MVKTTLLKVTSHYKIALLNDDLSNSRQLLDFETYNTTVHLNDLS